MQTCVQGESLGILEGPWMDVILLFWKGLSGGGREDGAWRTGKVIGE